MTFPPYKLESTLTAHEQDVKLYPVFAYMMTKQVDLFIG